MSLHNMHFYYITVHSSEPTEEGGDGQEGGKKYSITPNLHIIILLHKSSFYIYYLHILYNNSQLSIIMCLL